MASESADLVVRVAANIAAMQADMSSAAASIKTIESAVVDTNAASAGWMGSLDALGHSWVARIAEGELLRDAVREVLSTMKELAAFLPELAMKGAGVADVEENFKHLAAQAGLTSDALMVTLRAATHGTIDDFQLMQRVNKDLAAGLNLTDDQFGMLGQAAFALSQTYHISTIDAMDKMSDAMVTGRAKGVAMLTGKIDLKAAEEAYALALHGTADQLTAEQKLDADRQAILAGVAAGLARVGDQTDGLDEKVAQAQVIWSNFEDELGKTIATSPVIAAGLDTIKSSLTEAFGGNQQALIDAIVAKVNSAAIVVVDVGIAGVEAARVINFAWSAVQTVVLGIETAFMGAAAVIASTIAAVASAAGSLPGASQGMRDFAASAKDAATNLWAQAASLDAQTKAAAQGMAGTSAFDKTLDTLGGTLFQTRDAMIAASAAHAAAVKPLQDVNTAATGVSGTLKMSAADAKKWAEAVLEVESAGADWKGTFDTMDGAIASYAESLLRAGVSQAAIATYFGLTATQVKSLTLDIKDQDETLKQHASAIELIAKLWADYDESVSRNTGTVLDGQIAAIDKWGVLQSAAIDKLVAENKISAADAQAAYDGLTAAWSAKLNGLLVDTAALIKVASTDSKEGLQQIADKAEATYLEAATHVGEWKDSTIQAFRDTATAAQLAADSWGTSFEGAADDAAASLQKVTAAANAAKAAADQAAASARATSGFTMQSQFSLNPNDRASWAARVAAFGPNARVAYDSYNNPYVYIPGVNAAPPMAEGGPVSSGASYLVGERGPELFVPSASGTIVPNGAGGGNLTIHQTIYVTQPLGTPQAIGKAVGDAQLAGLRNSGVRLPTGV